MRERKEKKKKKEREKEKEKKKRYGEGRFVTRQVALVNQVEISCTALARPERNAN